LTTMGSGSAPGLTLTNGIGLTGWVSSPENFVKIGHSLLALLLAWLGGLLSRRLWRSSRLSEGPLQPESGKLESSGEK
jgi:hypothetical protein